MLKPEITGLEWGQLPLSHAVPLLHHHHQDLLHYQLTSADYKTIGLRALRAEFSLADYRPLQKHQDIW